PRPRHRQARRPDPRRPGRSRKPSRPGLDVPGAAAVGAVRATQRLVIRHCQPPYFLRSFSMSAGDSIHSSENPQCEQRKRVTLTLEKIVQPTGMLFPAPELPIIPGIRINSCDPHFGQVPVVFTLVLLSANASAVSSGAALRQMSGN